MTAQPAERKKPQPLPPITHDNQWTCRICGQHHVVAALARDCEEKHREA